MSKIVDIQLRINDNDVELIAKRKDYTEVQAIELSEIQNEIKKIILFCENLKTKDEELKEQKEKLLDFVTNHSSDEEKANNPELFEKWSVGKAYRLNDYINHLGIVYKCKKEHIANYEYIPSITKDYWEKLQKSKEVDPTINPEWQENFESAENYSRDKSYKKGDYVKYYNELYKAKKNVTDEQLPSSISEYWEHITKKISNLGM